MLASCCGVGLIFGFEPPLIALVLRRGGESAFAAGAVNSASLIAVMMLGPFYPAIIARLGLKACVLAGVAGSAALLLLMPPWPSLGYWLFLRVFTGCMLGLAWIASEVWLNVIGNAQDRGVILGLYGTVFSAGVMAGPALLEATGTRGWPPFVAGAAAALLSIAPLVGMSRLRSAPQAFRPMGRLIDVLGRSPVVMLAAWVAGLIEAAELTLLPLFGMQAGLDDRTALSLLTVFMAGNVVLQIPIGLLADRLGRRLLLTVCALASTVGPLLLPAALTQPLLLWPLVFVWGGTLYGFYSQGVAVLGEEFPEADLPTANTVFVMVYCFGGVIGPSLGGLLMDAWPGRGLLWLLAGTAAVMVVALAGGAFMRGRGGAPVGRIPAGPN